MSVSKDERWLIEPMMWGKSKRDEKRGPGKERKEDCRCGVKR